MARIHPSVGIGGFSLALLMSCTAQAAESASYTALPPPPPPRSEGRAEQPLMLELVVNGRRTQIVAPVIRLGDRFKLASGDLARAGIKVSISAAALWLDEWPGIAVRYDGPLQQLHLDVDPEILPGQKLEGRKAAITPASHDMGALLNYDVYVSGGNGRKVDASVYHEARVFIGADSLSSTGLLRGRKAPAYVRYDTSWRRSNEMTATTIEAGDFITRGLPWTPAVRMGGLQVSRDFAVRPDIITYPLPEFKGVAALPSTVDLLVGGQRIAGGSVDPGPFEIAGLAPISGAGEANLILTDMHGRSMAAAMPFYVSTSLLRPGLTDFAVAFGAFRENYGIRNFDYGDVAATASARHGVTGGLTLEVHAEIANDMQLAGGGAVVKLGQGGVISGSYSRSVGRAGSGGQYSIGYEFQARSLSIAVRHSGRDAGFTDLGLLDSGIGDARKVSSAVFSLALGGAGTFGLGYFAIDRVSGSDSRLANASWNVPLGAGVRLAASGSHDFGAGQWSGALSISFALGARRGNLGAGYAKEMDGRGRWRADYSRSIPSSGGVGWSAGAVREEGGSTAWRGDMSWRSDAVLLRAGAYGSGGVTGWAGASGSLVVMDGSLFAANRIADAFVVVNTGEPDIPVRYENQLVGRTNDDGQLLIPWASAYYPAKYEIDPLALPSNVRVPVTSARVAVARGGGHVLRFAVERLVAVRATLVGSTGEPLPVGARVWVNNADPTYVGWDGMLFVDRAQAVNQAIVELPNGNRCVSDFEAPSDGDAIIDIGEVACRSVAN